MDTLNKLRQNIWRSPSNTYYSPPSHFLKHLAITTIINTNTRYRINGIITSQNRKVSMVKIPGGATATSSRWRPIPMEMQLSIILFLESCCLPSQLIRRPSLDRTLPGYLRNFFHPCRRDFQWIHPNRHSYHNELIVDDR